MTTEDRIRNLKRQIASMEETLPYADGQAYYEEKRRIFALREELIKLESGAENGK